METVAKCFRHQDYTIAWICALPLEMTAAAAMLDERHCDLPVRSTDSNAYILGRIYSHNVAIACLPSGVYGTTAATNVATQMLSTFESIRFCLMVGIGGGVPSSKNDIRLGDVVVSKPTRDLGGVIQYDYGKTVAGGCFERTGILNKPPTVLLTAISKLQADHCLEPNKISDLLSKVGAMSPSMKDKFAYLGEDKDRLFDSEYDHLESENTCKNCDMRRLIARPARATHNPVIHYGLIASGNQVMKHGCSRDKLARDLDILCFEMEAAGLMDNFPCLVIRGICDYSDSHKSKEWQDYAAATAAAYAKELLSVVHGKHLVDTLPVGSVTAISSHLSTLPSAMKSFSSEIARTDHQHMEELLERISSYDHEKIHQRLSRKRLTGTTQWFLEHPDFKTWLDEKTIPSLWCSGKIGSGKTMIATAAIDAAKYKLSSPTVYFYCMNEHSAFLDASSVLCSFIQQLCELLQRASTPCPPDITRSIIKFFGHKRIKPDLEDLTGIFTCLFPHVKNTIYVIDGVDALDRNDAKSLLGLFRSLFVDSLLREGSRILLLSRDQVPGYINLVTFMPGIRHISTSANVMRDIESYIDSSITDKTLIRKLTDDHLLVAEIRQRLLSESLGMFLWVYLQLEILWDTCYTDAEIRFALAMLPEGLEDTYGHCLERINNTDNRAFKVLKWVSFATSPLHIEELREAIAFDPQDTAWNAENIPRKEFVIGCCANLVVVDPTDNRVRFAHSSVKQYLEKVRGKNIIQDYPTPAQGVLECGELCVAYLSFSDFNLQISTRKNENAALDVPSPMLFAQEALPGLFTRRFFQRRYDQNRSVSMAFRGIRTASAPDRTRYKFLDYAIANWAFQTKQISRTSPFWNKFEQLAMCFNETWNFHPWIPSGRSASSWLHGILGWAVMEQHAPLLSVVQTAGPSLQVICDLPLIGQGLPALHVAAKLGNQEIFKILLGFCKVNVPDLEGYTVLHHAASGGHIEICQFLLWSKKVDMNARSKLSCTPLISAAKNGHEEVVKMLLERGADFEAKDDKSRTPIWWAAEKSHDGVVKLLLEKGADFEVRDSRGETPLLLAIEKGHGIVVELLLERGVDFENKVQKDHTLLSWAAINGQEAVVRLLLKRGANHKAKDTRGRTPLLLAAANGHAAVIEELLARGADFKARDTDLRSPLSWAAMGGHEAVVNLLLKKGAYLEARDSRLRTPLLGAAMEGHETAVKLLLEKGADFKVKDSESRTPLLWAALKGHEAIVKLLLDKGADIETKDARSSRTPLSWAAENGHWALVKMLLERGAVNSDGHVIPS